MRPKRRVNTYLEDLAIQRAEILLRRAHAIYTKDPELARRYVYLAFTITKRARAKLPRHLKRSFCRTCYSPLIPGVTSRVRLRRNGKSRIVVTCLVCGRIYRYPYEQLSSYSQNKYSASSTNSSSVSS